MFNFIPYILEILKEGNFPFFSRFTYAGKKVFLVHILGSFHTIKKDEI